MKRLEAPGVGYSESLRSNFIHCQKWSAEPYALLLQNKKNTSSNTKNKSHNHRHKEKSSSV